MSEACPAISKRGFAVLCTCAVIASVIVWAGYAHMIHVGHETKRRTVPVPTRRRVLHDVTRVVFQALQGATPEGVQGVLMYGSLLGYIRDGVVPMAHDFDVDIAVDETHFAVVRDSVARAVADTPYVLQVHDYPLLGCRCMAIVDPHTELNLDIFFLRRTVSHVHRTVPFLYAYLYLGEGRYYHPLGDVYPLKPIPLLGLQNACVPNNARAMLASWYGPTWETPDMSCDADGYCK